MRFSAFATILLAALPVFGAPNPLLPIQKYQGRATGKYIVVLKDGVSKANVLSTLGAPIATAESIQWQIINGFAAELDDESLNILRASEDVDYITEDGIVEINDYVVQTDAPWGLGRISQDAKLTDQDPYALTYTYTYDESAGEGVDIYVVDTGVYIEHEEFEGRATWGATFGAGYGNADGNGHGTHCAGTAAGKKFGVAKKASIIAVKVLSDWGSGTLADVISGLDYVGVQAPITGRPSVVSMSLGGYANDALDAAVLRLTTIGVHVVVAAGNSADDVQWYSPARAPSAITVSASGIDDAAAYFSNYGALVDIWAPGFYIPSAWIGSPNATNVISGTSMATPHVSGLAAYFIAKDGNLSPAALSDKIQNLSVKNALTGVPSGTVNYLARNN
ncbi:hypothetical protein AX16_007013 [Volvariella volvacea WC 439]|nr:hypothetical protein AX16_007013 [Volvariella volvacea WC 439]